MHGLLKKLEINKFQLLTVAISCSASYDPADILVLFLNLLSDKQPNSERQSSPNGIQFFFMTNHATF